MQNTTILILGVLLLGFTPPVSAAAGAKKGERARKRVEQRELSQAIRRFDIDKNGKIDGSERDAVRKWFADIKALDKNSDGTLDDTEIDALKVPPSSRPGKAGKGKARRNGKAPKAARKNNEAPATS